MVAPVGRELRRTAEMKKRLIDSFVRQSDGRWKCIESVTLNSPKAVQFRSGMTWGPEDSYMGIKVAKLLDSLVETRRAGS
jgi:hypothetical protein